MLRQSGGAKLQKPNSLLSELEEAIKNGSEQRRVDTLRRVTDLFLNDADRLTDAQIGVFDDVLCHLIKRIETKAVAELSVRLAPVDNAPLELIRKLARDDELTVAGPVLTLSSRLTTDDLIEIARTKSQAHLLAISGRSKIAEAVTDELLTRGDRNVALALAVNDGARFSETGFATLVRHAESDDALAKNVGLRLDLPIRLLRDLLLRATEAVRNWLLFNAPAEAKHEVQRVLSDVASEVTQEAAAPRDFAAAQQLILAMQERAQLDEAAIREFASAKRYEEMVAALSTLSTASIQVIAALMKSPKHDGLSVVCKALGLKWPTVTAILKNRFTHHSISDHDLAAARVSYLELSQAAAQRTLRFWQVRTGAAKASSAA
jgi:uncharacterized protein (DUF2336 family)